MFIYKNTQKYDVINKVGTIDPAQFETLTRQWDELEASLSAVGIKYFSQEQVQQFLTEILNQRVQIKINYRMVDDILDDINMTR